MYQLENFWWDDGDEEAEYKHVFSCVKTLREDQSYRRDDNLNWLRLFTNNNVAGLDPYTYAQRGGSRADDVTLNLVRSMCTTVASRIAKNKPKVTFLTSGGDHGLKKKAQLLNKFVGGQFHATGIYKTAPRVFLDAAVFGTGVMKIYFDGLEIKAERVFPNEILTDDAESFYGEPRQLFQRKIVSKEVLIAAYPEFKEKILNASRPEEHDRSYGLPANQIECVEAWHLSSQKGANDGKHCICIDNATLLSEPYDKTHFPFVFLTWTEGLLGFWGQGLAEQLLGVQQEVNTQLNRIKTQMKMATPVVFVNRGAKISEQHITSEAWNIIEHDPVPGGEPKFHVPRTVSPEVLSHLHWLIMTAYEVAGISQMAAQAKKPGGLDSAVAIREYSDVQSDRFMLSAQMYEDMFIDAAKQMIDIARDMEAIGTPSEVISHGDESIERIKWADINLKDDEYVLKPYPTSLLSTTPAARLQTVQEMAQAGILTPQQALTLLEYPDMERVNQRMNAPYDEIELLLEEMLEKGVYHAPDTFSNLELAIKEMQGAYLRAKINNVPEENLELVRRYTDEATRIMKTVQNAAVEAQQAQGAQPAPGLPPEDQGAPPQGMNPELAQAIEGLQ